MIVRHKIYAAFALILFLSPAAISLTLKESVGTALKNNPAVIASQKRLDAANARLGSALGAFLPTVKVDGTIGRSYSQPSTMQITQPTSMGSVTQTMAFGTDDPSTVKSITTSLSQPIFIAALFPGYSIAQMSTDIAKEELQKTLQETAFNTTVAYFGLIKADEFLKLSKESMEMAKSHLNQVKAMINAGVSTRSDLLRAEVQMANADVAVTRARNVYELAKGAFNNILGNDIDAEISLGGLSHTPSNVKTPELKELKAAAVNCRPDWKLFKLAKGIAEQNVSVNRSAYFPSLMLSGQTGNRITEYPSYKSDINSWSITGIASITLFDGLGIQNRIREAEANLEAQKAAEESVLNGIMLEVRDAYLSLNTSLDTIISTKKAVELAEENQKVSDLRYRSGLGTNLEVLDAQVALTQARINNSQALFDLEIAKAKVNRSIGKEVF